MDSAEMLRDNFSRRPLDAAWGRSPLLFTRQRSADERTASMQRGVMAIYRLLQEREAAFEPEAVQAIAGAFEEACRKLGLAERTDPLRDIVASKVLEVARTGERDPVRLCERALKEILK